MSKQLKKLQKISRHTRTKPQSQLQPYIVI